MPLGIVSEEDFLKEIEDSAGEVKKQDKIESHISIIEQSRGRGNTVETPEIIREIVAEDSILSRGNHKALAELTGVSTSSVSAYKNGVTSTANYNGKKDNNLNNVRTRISTRAANRLNEALKALSNKDLASETAKDISTIAKDMATVFDKISPAAAKERENEKQVHLHIHAPKQKSVSEYEVIDLN